MDSMQIHTRCVPRCWWISCRHARKRTRSSGTCFPGRQMAGQRVPILRYDIPEYPECSRLGVCILWLECIVSHTRGVLCGICTAMVLSVRSGVPNRRRNLQHSRRTWVAVSSPIWVKRGGTLMGSLWTWPWCHWLSWMRWPGWESPQSSWWAHI